MEIYLLRHAIAEPRDPFSAKPDSQRRLTPEGARKMRRIARGMKSLDLSFDAIVSSPFLRARETAEIVAAVFRLKKALQFSPALSAGAGLKKLIGQLKRLERTSKRVLLVGHEPDFSELISLLVAGNSSFSITLKKGGLARLTVETLRHGSCATLEWLLTPSQLASLR